MEKNYFINIGTKKIHSSQSRDKRFQVCGMKSENVLYFDKLQEALIYPNNEKPLAKKCFICEKKNYFKEN